VKFNTAVVGQTASFAFENFINVDTLYAMPYVYCHGSVTSLSLFELVVYGQLCLVGTLGLHVRCGLAKNLDLGQFRLGQFEYLVKKIIFRAF